MSKLIQIPAHALGMRYVHGFCDDFYGTIVAEDWTKVATDSGTVLTGDAAGGTVSLVCSDGTEADNDEVYMHRVNETFLCANDKPCEFETRLNFTEANTDDANVIVGFANAVAANLLQDDGAGPKADMSGFGFYKVDGGTTWAIYASKSTTQTLVTLTAANSLTGTAQTTGAGTNETLRASFNPVGSADAAVEFYIDGVLVYKITDWDYSSATEMEFVIGAKNGDTNTETIVVDYAWAYQKR